MLLLWVKFSVTLRKLLLMVAVMMMTTKSHNRISMDSKLQHTSPVVAFVNPVRVSDRRVDNEDYSRTVVVQVVMKEMRLANRWVQMDTFRLLHLQCDDDESDEGDFQ